MPTTKLIDTVQLIVVLQSVMILLKHFCVYFTHTLIKTEKLFGTFGKQQFLGWFVTTTVFRVVCLVLRT